MSDKEESSSIETHNKDENAKKPNNIKKESISKGTIIFSEVFKIREIGVLIALLLLFITFSVSSPVFFGLNNLLNILRQVSILGIISMGMTMVIVSGEIDLSVGAVLASLPRLHGFSPVMKHHLAPALQYVVLYYVSDSESYPASDFRIR